jgi:hypothetical protein
VNDVRANAVEVLKLFNARCRLDGCGWHGTLQPTYADANAERLAHLDEHRRQEDGQ